MAAILNLLFWLQTQPIRNANLSKAEMGRAVSVATPQNRQGWKELDEINKRFKKAKERDKRK